MIFFTRRHTQTVHIYSNKHSSTSSTSHISKSINSEAYNWQSDERKKDKPTYRSDDGEARKNMKGVFPLTYTKTGLPPPPCGRFNEQCPITIPDDPPNTLRSRSNPFFSPLSNNNHNDRSRCDYHGGRTIPVLYLYLTYSCTGKRGTQKPRPPTTTHEAAHCICSLLHVHVLMYIMWHFFFVLSK